MDHYSSADRTTLPRAVRRLLGNCDCNAKAAYRPGETLRRAGGCEPGTETRRFCPGDGTTYCAFEAGSGVVVDPTGAVGCHRSFLARQPSRGKASPERLDLGKAAPVPGLAWQDPNSATGHGDAPVAPLPAAFRVCRVGDGQPASVKFDVPTRGPDGVRVETEWKEIGPMSPRAIEFPRGALGNGLLPFPKCIERDLGSTIAEHEDNMCLELLHGLGAVGETYAYRWNSTLDGLARFVGGLNAPRPSELRLDTVIVNLGMYVALFGNDGRTPSWVAGYPFYGGEHLYRNMSVLDGIAFLYHPEVPHDCAYALSSVQGPVFAHGPTAIDCTSDGIAVTRHCGVVEPPRGLPECPWGVRFGVEKVEEAGS
ncbi:MAG: hypothetical protein EB832_00370 [Thaumarchaeota archaeon S14]|nr:MAG: hypothetical protein EB832_00370 [Thaumarchaeota archaeon S14]